MFYIRRFLFKQDVPGIFSHSKGAGSDTPYVPTLEKSLAL